MCNYESVCLRMCPCLSVYVHMSVSEGASVCLSHDSVYVQAAERLWQCVSMHVSESM